MLSETFQSITNAVRKVRSNWTSMALLALVYAALLAALYFFLAVREASVVQVAVTFLLAIAAMILFFLLHALIASRAATGPETNLTALLKRAGSNLWKLVVISLPLIGLAILIAYLLNKAQNFFGVSASTAREVLDPLTNSRTRTRSRPPIDWKIALFSWLRYLAFALVLPLAAIHLWLATVREGLGAAVRRIGTHLARAFAPQSVLIYIVGFVVFGVLPYFLLFKPTPTNKAWLEISLLVLRLGVVFALTLFGWVVTVWALSLFSTSAAREQANEVA